LVLPTVVLATLHWYQLRWDARETLEAMPAEARHAAARLGEALRVHSTGMLEAEDRRPYYHYQSMYSPPGAVGNERAFLPSPFSLDPPPQGISCRFSYDFDEGAAAPLTFFDPTGGDRERIARRHQVARELVEREWRDSFMRRTSPYAKAREERFPLAFAALNQSSDPLGCASREFAALAALEDSTCIVRTSGFHLRLRRETDGTPFLIATRQVWIEPSPELAEHPACLSELANGATLVDGFFVDPEWLLEELPAHLAEQVLGGSQRLLGADSPAVSSGKDVEVVRLRPVEELQIETRDPEDRHYSAMQLVVSTKELRAHFRGQMLRFFGVAAMLSCSLATGLWLLLASVRRDLEYARHTENFVSAVTHELRTPVTAIRMYGEMLRDGWVDDEQKVHEYHERIVTEALRLETMVERVLEKGRLVPGRSGTRVGDLSEEVMRFRTETELLGTHDLVWDLARGLPLVHLQDEALHSILTNLVENARKYAPVPPGSDEDRKIRVRTTLVDGSPVLEVSDRGPGIPDTEKEHVLGAFYRIGNEATRSTRGTGLGLHLVDLQAKALGGGVSILDRTGGGTTFRVRFAPGDRDLPATG